MTQAFVHFLRRSIARKLTLTLVGFVAVTMIAAGLYLNRALEAFAVDTLEVRLATIGRLMHDEARALVSRGASPAEVRAFASRGSRPTGSRITVIAADGRVLGDSEVAVDDLPRVENHGSRPEVLAARAGGVGRDRRTSATIGASLLYVALPIVDGARVIGVIRVALPVAAVTSSYAAIHRVMLAGGLVALVVAFGIGLFVARRVTKPVVQMQAIAHQMSEGDFTVRAPIRSPDEIGALGRALNGLAARLREKVHDLGHEQAKATAILDGMIEGVIAVDGRDVILLLNERARSMFGLDATRGEGKPFLEVIRNTELHEAFREGRAAGESSVSNRELRLASPVERRVQVNAVPLRLGESEVGVVMVLHDVTELRRLEQVRTEFVANVSHELRTPLTAIQGYLETLLTGALEEQENARRFLEIVFRHTERLGRLLNDLTDLSNIELGRVSLKLAPTRLDEAVDAVLAIMAAKAKSGQVALRSQLPRDLPPVLADRDRLVQILINLVDNAVKYTPEGGRVTVRVQEPAGGWIEVDVVDTGIGIPPADLPRITERFYRVDKARSRELGGTGLGLAIVKHLVFAHGAQLRIESEPGRGTTVRVRLSCQDPASAKPDVASPA
ncbi:MAG: PAS domain-containing sensor histidine kinase [Candidatus Rokuibacteriota bacterium]|nr:MAG: PAS domain-containing sensor histidine kinase [Candidatus Rokubacteria bacterium]